MNYHIEIICTYRNKVLVYEAITETIEEEEDGEWYENTYVHREVYCWRRR